MVKQTLVGLWRWWQAVARRIADVQARILLSLLYFVLVPPFALGARLLADPLRLSRRARPGWQSRAPDTRDPVTLARQQF